MAHHFLCYLNHFFFCRDLLVFQELRDLKARRVLRELQEILVSQDVLVIPE